MILTVSDGSGLSGGLVIGAIVVVAILFLFLITCVIVMVIRRCVIKRPDVNTNNDTESDEPGSNNNGVAKVTIDARLTPQLYKIVASRLPGEQMRMEYMDAFQSRKKRGTSSRGSSAASSVINVPITQNGVSMSGNNAHSDVHLNVTPAAHADVGL